RRALARLDPRVESGAEGAYAAPRTPVEELVSAIWSEVLAVEQVGAEDDFFALGGHSLLATRVISRVRQAFGIDLPLRSLFEATTVAAFARQVESALAARTGLGRQAPPLLPLRRDRALPLSFAQERLWLIDQLQPGSAAYNMPAALRLRGELDLAALAATFAELDRRHESLRTTFRAIGGEPVQVIHPAAPKALRRVDLTVLSAERREGEARRLARDEARRPFDLAAGPLLRLTLVHLRGEPGEHLVLLTQHHIISDGWSMGVLIRELGALYTAFHAGRLSPLPELGLQYADFAVWQREWLAGGELEVQLEYWRARLAGAPELLELPLDRPRTAAAAGSAIRAGRLQRKLPAPLSRSLRQLGRREPGRESTLFMVLLAAWSAFLSRISGQQEVVVGTPIANRTHREVEGLIGFFVNTLALRTDLTGDPEFTALLSRVRRTTLADYAHQDLPFERLVGEMTAERSLSQSPLFQSFLALQNTGAERLELPGLTLEALPAAGEAVKFDLSVAFAETPAGLGSSWEYRASLLEATTVTRLAAAFETLLTGAVERPEARLSELPLLSAAERHQLLVGWNDAVGKEPSETCLHQLFETQALRRPHALALVTGEAALSYGELESRAERLAGRLMALGVGPEERVGICLPRSFELLAAILGVLKAGAAYLPIDLSNPRERVLFLLADSRVPVLVSSRQLAGGLRQPLAEQGTRVVEIDEPGEGEAESRRSRRNRRPPGADSLAYVIYTSGSTGTPNGVLVPHRGPVNLLRQARDLFGVGPESRVLQIASPGFDASVLEIFLALGMGASLCLASEEERLAPAALADTLVSQGVTTVVLTPSFLSVLPEGSLAAVSAISVGGEACSGDLAARWASAPGGRRLLNCYGPTEASIFATAEICGGDGGAPPIGRPVAGVAAYVVDARLVPVTPGVAGELALGGLGLARGYLDRPARTAERFVPDPWSERPGSRLYRTGDLARHRPGGRLEFLGRADDQVKLRGLRIELGEIEVALTAHPEVTAAVVLAPADRRGERRLVAYLAADPARTPAVADLRRFLAERLPAYMVPAEIHFLAALPVTTGGKVDRRALARLEPRAESRGEGGYAAAPRSPVEELLAEIWSDVLGLERVGMQDDFFALGGHSLLATRLVSRVRETFGVDLPLRRVFETPTIAGLAAAIAGDLPTATRVPPLLPAARPREIPLSFAQERLWFLDQLDPGSVAYNMPLPVRLSGALKPAVLAAVLDEVVRRHEVLRTTFPVSAGRPVQAIAPPGELALPLIDLAGLPGEARAAETARLGAADTARPFDLARGPLIRADLLRLAASEHALLLSLHHIASDGWSIGVLIREVAALYTAFAAGRPSPLPELAVQYADFALWQRGWLAGETLAGELAYWRERLAGAPEVLDLPLDLPRPAVRTFRGGQRLGSLAPGAAAALTALSRRSGATLFMTL
ncbi:MAG: hypothetical protein QOJ16_4371, partial [Acidobacteriota bacterium]|nr:hypothetical protein [Acidobacteriota bacterium]